MLVCPSHLFSLCSLISAPSTLLKWLNYNSSGNYNPTRQQRSIWQLKPFLKAIFLLTSEAHNSLFYLLHFDTCLFPPFSLEVFLQVSFLAYLSFHSIVPLYHGSRGCNLYFHDFNSPLGGTFQHFITELGFSQEF